MALFRTVPGYRVSNHQGTYSSEDLPVLKISTGSYKRSLPRERHFHLWLFKESSRWVNYLVNNLGFVETQTMSFSSPRRWFSRADGPSEEVTSNSSGPPRAQAQFLNGLKFASGEGVAQDYTQAAQCYSQAAEQDHSLAQLHLAMLYAQGQGVARDEAKSLMWLTKAAKLGNAAAQYRLGDHQHLLFRERW